MTSPQDGRYPGPYAPESRNGGPPPAPPQGGYNPYGPPQAPRGRNSPFVPPPSPRKRPLPLLAAVGLLALGALPWLVFGTAFAVVPLNVQGVIDAGTLAGSPLAGYTAEQIATGVRAIAAACAVIAAVYLVLVGLTFGRRNWARIVVTVLTGLFAVLLLISLVQAPSLITAVLVAVLVAGAALLFTRPVSAWFAG